MATIDTPLGPATLRPTGIGYFDDTQTYTSVSVRLTVPRPGTKSKSLWELHFTVPYDPLEAEVRAVSIYGAKKDGLGRDQWLGGRRGQEWKSVTDKIRLQVVPLVLQWIAENQETRDQWQREALERAAAAQDGKAERYDKEAGEARTKASYLRELAAAI